MTLDRFRQNITTGSITSQASIKSLAGKMLHASVYDLFGATRHNGDTVNLFMIPALTGDISPLKRLYNDRKLTYAEFVAAALPLCEACRAPDPPTNRISQFTYGLSEICLGFVKQNYRAGQDIDARPTPISCGTGGIKHVLRKAPFTLEQFRSDNRVIRTDMLQSLFMSISARAYMEFMTANSGNTFRPNLDRLFRYSDADSDYNFTFEAEHTEVNNDVTIGEMLFIARHILFEAKREPDPEKKRLKQREGSYIVNCLMVYPFASAENIPYLIAQDYREELRL